MYWLCESCSAALLYKIGYGVMILALAALVIAYWKRV